MPGPARPVLDNLVKGFPNAPFEISIASFTATAPVMERWCLVLVAHVVGWMNRTLPIDTDQGL
jgi:hypothetical protein